MKPTISVIIPTYNRAQLVTEAIDSVLLQTRVADEIIVVDDGSTDNTAAALAAYRDRILLVRQENAGVNAARNRGLDVATGSFIALLDSDDVWLPFKTELEMAALGKCPDSGFVFSDFDIWRPGVRQQPQGIRTWHQKQHDWSEIFVDRISGATLNLDGRSAPDEDFDLFWGDIYAASLAEPFVLPSTAIIRRDRLDELLFDATDSTCGDWSFFSRLSKRHRAVYIDKETTLNRSHDDAVRLTRLDKATQLERRLAMTRKVWGSDPDFEQSNPGQAAMTAVTLLHQLARLELKSERPERAIQFLDEASALGLARRRPERMLLRMLASAPVALALAKRANRFYHNVRR